MALNEQTDAVFKSRRTNLDAVPDNTVGVDPVSGNEVPLGSSPEEVRDDIPAQLSEGEYVVPADVVRYYGVKFFEDLRAEAKFGYKDMEENGRIGGEPAGMETVEPEDDMMFDESELEVVEMNQGGYALNPGDPGYDESGSLGLGSEGIPLGTGEDAASVEMVAYINDEGRVIYIMHINGVPQNEIPAGFYPRTDEEETEEEDATDAQPPAQVVAQDDDDGGPEMEAPTPIDYQNLTLDEMQEMLDDQQSPKMNVIAGGLGALNPIMGLFMKGAMMHQSRSLEKEMRRRLDGELTTQERARLEGMLKQHEEGGGLKKLFGGKAKDAILDITKGPEQGPGMDIQPPQTYTPEVAAGSVTKPYVSDDQMKDILKSAEDAVTAGQKQRQPTPPTQLTPTPTQPSDGGDSDSTGYSAAGTGDVLSAMEDRDAPQAAVTAAENEASRIKDVLESRSKGTTSIGFKKGGLASKKKK